MSLPGSSRGAGVAQSDRSLAEHDEACWLAHRLAGRAELLEELVRVLRQLSSQAEPLASLKSWIRAEIINVKLETQVLNVEISNRAQLNGLRRPSSNNPDLLEGSPKRNGYLSHGE